MNNSLNRLALILFMVLGLTCLHATAQAQAQTQAQPEAPKKTELWGNYAGANAAQTCPKAKEKAIAAAQKTCDMRHQELEGGYTIGKCVTDAVHISTVKVTFGCITPEIKPGQKLSYAQNDACEQDLSKWCTDSGDASSCLKSKASALAKRCHSALGFTSANMFSVNQPFVSTKAIR